MGQLILNNLQRFYYLLTNGFTSYQLIVKGSTHVIAIVVQIALIAVASLVMRCLRYETIKL